MQACKIVLQMSASVVRQSWGG